MASLRPPYLGYVSSPFRCAECGSTNHVFAAFSESLLAISSDVSTDAVLRRIVDVARDLVHASYGAIGVSEAMVAPAAAVTSGANVPSEVAHAAAGVVERLLDGQVPYVTSDVHRDARFEGWPDGFPELKSLLVVPITNRAEVLGVFSVGNENAWGFTGDQKDLVELLATHAGLAIKNARLHEHSRELSVVQERNRLARELHDSLTQTLFSMKLAAETANTLIESDAGAARAEIERLQELAKTASSEMRSLIFELRPPELEVDGLATTIRKHVDALRRVHDVSIELHHEGQPQLDPRREKELLRIVQEALNNALRHAAARKIVVELLSGGGKVKAAVTDDGRGFDPAAPVSARSFGLTSMRERAAALDATLVVSSEPGRGTTVSVEVAR